MFKKIAAIAAVLASRSPCRRSRPHPSTSTRPTPPRIAHAAGRHRLSKAKAIVAFREEHGPFKSVDDLTQVKGIGPATLKRNHDAILLTGEGANAKRRSRRLQSQARPRNPRPQRPMPAGRLSSPRQTGTAHGGPYHLRVHSRAGSRRPGYDCATMIVPRYRIDASRITGAGKGLFLEEPVAAGRIITAPDTIEKTYRLDELLAQAGTDVRQRTLVRRPLHRSRRIGRTSATSTTASSPAGCGIWVLCLPCATCPPARRSPWTTATCCRPGKRKTLSIRPLVRES